jgi:hypothetical protein
MLIPPHLPMAMVPPVTVRCTHDVARSPGEVLGQARMGCTPTALLESANDQGAGVQEPLPEVALDQELVLLRIAAAQHEVVLRRYEPVELLEPGRLAHVLGSSRRLHLGGTCAGLQAVVTCEVPLGRRASCLRPSCPRGQPWQGILPLADQLLLNRAAKRDRMTVQYVALHVRRTSRKRSLGIIQVRAGHRLLVCQRRCAPSGPQKPAARSRPPP